MYITFISEGIATAIHMVQAMINRQKDVGMTTDLMSRHQADIAQRVGTRVEIDMNIVHPHTQVVIEVVANIVVGAVATIVVEVLNTDAAVANSINGVVNTVDHMEETTNAVVAVDVEVVVEIGAIEAAAVIAGDMVHDKWKTSMIQA